MKVVAISDTHNKLDSLIEKGLVPDGDVLIHSGDATSVGKIEEFAKFNDDLGKLNHEIKIFIPGNHDIGLQTDPFNSRRILTNVSHFLMDSFTIIEGIKIYGSPWTPQFYNWAFMLERGEEISEKWNLIPDDTDVLITHGPPFGVLDEVPMGPFLSKNIGCTDLKLAVDRVRPKFHVFGHCHSGYGTHISSDTTFINASSLDERYVPSNRAKVFWV